MMARPKIPPADDDTQPPADDTQPPADDTQPPADDTQPPADPASGNAPAIEHAQSLADDAVAPHDRVQMLSLHADGTPDQLDPEIIGPKDAALKGARTQFAEQAVSAVDTMTEPSRVTLVGQEDGSSVAIPATRDASGIGAVELVKVHEAAQAAGEAAAEAVVNELHRP